MRRAAATLACLGLLAALAVAPGSGPIGGTGGRAQAAECAWQRHSKQTIAKVHRHGQVRRVVRTRHWWTCESVAAPPLASPTAPTVPAAAPTAAPEAEPTANRLGVKSAEYSYTLSRPSVEAGEVTIELDNRGEDAHNLNLQREGSAEAPLQVPETESQHRSTVEFDLPPGTYRLWCSLPEHEERGMHATLVVGGG
jgi:plastocyanin